MSYPYPVTSSGVLTATTQVTSRTSLLAGIDMKKPTIGTALLQVYDSNNGANGTILAEFEVDAGLPAMNHEYVNFITANKGIYAVLTDTSGTANFIIRYALI